MAKIKLKRNNKISKKIDIVSRKFDQNLMSKNVPLHDDTCIHTFNFIDICIYTDTYLSQYNIPHRMQERASWRRTYKKEEERNERMEQQDRQCKGRGGEGGDWTGRTTEATNEFVGVRVRDGAYRCVHAYVQPLIAAISYPRRGMLFRISLPLKHCPPHSLTSLP